MFHALHRGKIATMDAALAEGTTQAEINWNYILPQAVLPSY